MPPSRPVLQALLEDLRFSRERLRASLLVYLIMAPKGGVPEDVRLPARFSARTMLSHLAGFHPDGTVSQVHVPSALPAMALPCSGNVPSPHVQCNPQTRFPPGHLPGNFLLRMPPFPPDLYDEATHLGR